MANDFRVSGRKWIQDAIWCYKPPCGNLHNQDYKRHEDPISRLKHPKQFLPCVFLFFYFERGFCLKSPLVVASTCWDHDLLSASAPLGDAMCRGRRLWMVATQKLILLWCMNGLDGWGGFHAYITFTKSSKSKWWYFVCGKYGKSSICAINQIKRRLLLDHRRRLQFPHSMVLDRISSWAQGKNRAPPVFQWIFQDGSKSWT